MSGDTQRCKGPTMKRFMLSITEEMEKALERERGKRMLDSIPETVRMILSEHLVSERVQKAVDKALDQAVK